MAEPTPHHSPVEILKAQRTLIFIFGFATLMPSLWMVMMAWSAFQSAAAAPVGSEGFFSFVIYWGLAAPVVWLGANATALTYIRNGHGDKAKLFPLIPAFWAIIWFSSQLTG